MYVFFLVFFYSQVVKDTPTESWQTTVESSAEKQEFGIFRSKTNYDVVFMISSLLKPQYPMPFFATFDCSECSNIKRLRNHF